MGGYLLMFAFQVLDDLGGHAVVDNDRQLDAGVLQAGQILIDAT